MTDREFIVWLEGFNDSEPNRVGITPIQWSRIIKKLKTVTSKTSTSANKPTQYFDQAMDVLSTLSVDDSQDIRCKTSSTDDTINKSNTTPFQTNNDSIQQTILDISDTLRNTRSKLAAIAKKETACQI